MRTRSLAAWCTGAMVPLKRWGANGSKPSAGSSTDGTIAANPFVWTKTADEILTHARSGPTTSFTRR